MSWEYANKLSVQLQAEVEELWHRSQTETGESLGDIDMPQEIHRREDRLSKVAQVKTEIEARAQGRYERKKLSKSR